MNNLNKLKTHKNLDLDFKLIIPEKFDFSKKINY